MKALEKKVTGSIKPKWFFLLEGINMLGKFFCTLQLFLGYQLKFSLSNYARRKNKGLLKSLRLLQGGP